MVAEEGACGGAAGAVDGGVVDTGEADRLGGVAQEAREGEVARARGLGDEEVGAVALGGAVRVVAELLGDAADAGEAVQRPRVALAARLVAEHERAELLFTAERDEPSLDG